MTANILSRIFELDRTPKPVWRRVYDRLAYLSNPFRSHELLPDFLRDNALWHRAWALGDGPRYAWWRLFNLKYSKMLRQHPPESNAEIDLMVAELDRRGITTSPGFVPPEQVAVLRKRAEYYLTSKRGVVFNEDGTPDVSNASIETDYGFVDPKKRYQVNIGTRDMTPDCPILHYMLSPEILGIAARHLGFFPRLNTVSIWLNVPTDDVERRSQRWHSDMSDFVMLKNYLYLNDVGEENGPFCFIPGTNMGGDKRYLVPKVAPFRSSEDMRKILPEEHWASATGPAGTLSYGEVSGLHRGGRVKEGYRLLIVAEYASHSPWKTPYYRPEEVTLEPLSPMQRAAIGKA